MTYSINARLEHGKPSLTLVNADTGEQCLHWHGNNQNARDWQHLFKQLVLLSCIDQLSLPQRATSSSFGEECIACTECADLSTSQHNLTLMKN